MAEAVPKIEGHAAFYAHLRSGHVEEARIIGLENDRFVEKILLGRKFYEAPIITSRICGICPTIHNITSAKAIEAASGITASSQTEMLRQIMLCGQMIQSHALHLYLLVLPDYVGVSSSFELQKNHPDLFQNAISLKQYADKILDVFGGRAVHPISNVPGGFKSFPSKDKIKELVKIGPEMAILAEKTLQLFASFKYPQVEQKLIYSALTSEKEYALYDGTFKTSEGKGFAADNYTHNIYEELKHYSRAKFATLKGKEMMVGALARVNLNRKQLAKETLEFMVNHPIKHYFNNPFENIIAQAIELHHFVVTSQKLMTDILDKGLDTKEPIRPTRKFGLGVAACEAPRGTLIHMYELDKDGYIAKCDIVTPTVQNLAALESDMERLLSLIKDLKTEERNGEIEKLIRAYDPCITCATH